MISNVSSACMPDNVKYYLLTNKLVPGIVRWRASQGHWSEQFFGEALGDDPERMFSDTTCQSVWVPSIQQSQDAAPVLCW